MRQICPLHCLLRHLPSRSPCAHTLLTSQQVARGQDAYFKGVIKHRGISTPGVDAVVKAFLAGTDMEPAELRALGLELLREPLQVLYNSAAASKPPSKGSHLCWNATH